VSILAEGTCAGVSRHIAFPGLVEATGLTEVASESRYE
jgi:hypothetical protein